MPRSARIGLFNVALVLAASVIGACGFAPTGPPSWKVDVANANEPILISIHTNRAGWSWVVPQGARLVLLNEASPPQEGVIELADPRTCKTYDKVELLLTSFTIVPERTALQPLDYKLRLTSGAPTVGLPNTEFEGGCSG